MSEVSILCPEGYDPKKEDPRRTLALSQGVAIASFSEDRPLSLFWGSVSSADFLAALVENQHGTHWLMGRVRVNGNTLGVEDAKLKMCLAYPNPLPEVQNQEHYRKLCLGFVQCCEKVFEIPPRSRFQEIKAQSLSGAPDSLVRAIEGLALNDPDWEVRLASYQDPQGGEST